jgi:plastocyanin
MASALRRFAIAVSLISASTIPVLAGDVVKLNITVLTFAPADLTAHVGDTIEWVNGDFVDHTATASGAEWDIAVPAEKTARLELKHAGTFDYICRFHPNMTGRIRVLER